MMTKPQHLLSTASELPWTLHLFEKEKGGTGSTGSLISAAHSVLLRGEQVTFVEASVTQQDVVNAYGGHHRVHEVDLTTSDARDKIMEAVVSSPPGAHIFVNVPGGRLEELDRVHELVDYTLAEALAPIDVAITWTMGLDAASRSTLDALLESHPPGRLLLNLPSWHGDATDFKQVDEALISAVRATGGTVFQMPALDVHLYDHFRVDQVAIDRLKGMPGLSFGNKAALGLWERRITETLTGIY